MTTEACVAELLAAIENAERFAAGLARKAQGEFARMLRGEGDGRGEMAGPGGPAMSVRENVIRRLELVLAQGGEAAAAPGRLDAGQGDRLAGFFENLSRNGEWLLRLPFARAVAGVGPAGGQKREKTLARLAASPLDAVAATALAALAQEDKVGWADPKVILRVDLLTAHGAPGKREPGGKEIGEAILRWVVAQAGEPGRAAAFVRASPFSVRRRAAMALLWAGAEEPLLAEHPEACEALLMTLLADPALEVWSLAARALGGMGGGVRRGGPCGDQYRSLVCGREGTVVLQRRALAGLGAWAGSGSGEAFDVLDRIARREEPCSDPYQAANAALGLAELAAVDPERTGGAVERFLRDTKKPVEPALFFLQNAAGALLAARGETASQSWLGALAGMVRGTVARLPFSSGPGLNVVLWNARSVAEAAAGAASPEDLDSALRMVWQGIGPAGEALGMKQLAAAAGMALEMARQACEKAPLGPVGDGADVRYDEGGDREARGLFRLWQATNRVVLDREGEGLATFAAAGETAEAAGAVRAAAEQCRSRWGRAGGRVEPDKVAGLVLATRRRLHDASLGGPERLGVWRDVAAYCGSSDFVPATEAAHGLGVVLSAAGGSAGAQAAVAPLVRVTCSKRFKAALASAGREGLESRMPGPLAEALQEAGEAVGRAQGAGLEEATRVLAAAGAFRTEREGWPLRTAVERVERVARCLTLLPWCIDVVGQEGCMLGDAAGRAAGQEGCPAARSVGVDSSAGAGEKPLAAAQQSATQEAVRLREGVDGVRAAAAAYVEISYGEFRERTDALMALQRSIEGLAAAVEHAVPESCGNPVRGILQSWQAALAAEHAWMDEAATRRRCRDDKWAYEQERTLSHLVQTAAWGGEGRAAARRYEERCREERLRWLRDWTGGCPAVDPAVCRIRARLREEGNQWDWEVTREGGGLGPAQGVPEEVPEGEALRGAAEGLEAEMCRGAFGADMERVFRLGWKMRESCPANLQQALSLGQGPEWTFDLSAEGSELPWEALPVGTGRESVALNLCAVTARLFRHGGVTAHAAVSTCPRIGVILGLPEAEGGIREASADGQASRLRPMEKEREAVIRQASAAGLEWDVLERCARVEELRDFLAHGFGILHVIAHRVLAPGNPEIQLQGGLRLQAALLEQALPERAPWLVFLNSCRSARNLATAASPASALMRRGSMLVGTLFSQASETAAVVAEEFYCKLFQGRPVGRALLDGRKKAAEKCDRFSALSYVLCGDSAAQLPRSDVVRGS